MLANTLEYIQRLLFDFRYDRNIQEAIMFYFFYLAVQWYLMVGFGILADNYHNLFFGLLMFLSPYILNMTLAMCFIVKKNLHDNFSIFLAAFTFFGAILGPTIALMPVMILSTMWDNSPENIIKKFEREQLEHDIEVERQLWVENAAKKLEESKNNTKDKEITE